MAPRVASNLVAFGQHSPEDGGVSSRRVVYGAFGPIYARDVESCNGVVVLEQVEELVGIVIRAIIEAEGHGPRFRALVNIDTIWHFSKLGP